MSYEKVKSLTFNHKKREIIIYSCSNNVCPKHYDERYVRTHDNNDDYYKDVERYFHAMIGNSLQFLPSCKSKSKRAYDKTVQHLYDTYKACPMDLWWTWRNGCKFTENEQEKITQEMYRYFLENI